MTKISRTKIQKISFFDKDFLMTRQHIKLIQNKRKRTYEKFFMSFMLQKMKVKELIVFHNKPFLFVLV